MAKGPSFTGRILLALILMIGFYVLAISIALGLFYIPYAEVVYGGRLHIKLAILCVIGGCLILWSVLPRFDRFYAPGPLLTADDQPELFRQLESVAEATGQAMPVEVYAIPEMNAWVAQRGGVMGIGSRRVMGLGVPLMQVLSTQQFRGVLAHEFGHYHGGDTKLGPWIFTTRGAIIRTVTTLVQSESLLSKPFEWYGKLFLWITQAISRRQEYQADELAAQVAGPQALIDSLKVIHSSAQAFDLYWQNEYVPVLSSGFRAPLADGFQQFYQGEEIQKALQEALAEEIKNGNADPYDSHPALRERIAALEQLQGPDLPPSDPPFIESVRDLDRLEVRMIEHLAAAVKERTPKPIGWSDVAEKVWIPFWKSRVAETKADLSGIRCDRIEELLSRPLWPQAILAHLFTADAPEVAKRDYTFGLLQMAFTLALHNTGWSIATPIGKPVLATKGEQQLEPFNLISDLGRGKLAPTEFSKRCSDAGISDLDFSLALS